MGKKNSGGNGDYYSVFITDPLEAIGSYTAECYDIIQALDMNFDEGEAFKAIWRKAAARQGKSKGTTALYDAEKVKFYGEGMVKKEKSRAKTQFGAPSQKQKDMWKWGEYEKNRVAKKLLDNMKMTNRDIPISLNKLNDMYMRNV